MAKKDDDAFIDPQTWITKFNFTRDEEVEPLHTSRMHQPSGILRVGDKPVELEDDSLLNIITPRLLKIEIEDDLYRKAYKSYKFGEVLPITKKWWVWVIVAVVAVFVIQIVTGNFKV